MINSVITRPITLASNSSPVAFENDAIVTRSSTCCGWLQHTEGSPLYKILNGGIYDITFTGTVTSATAGVVALGVAEDGIVLPCTVSAETLATAGDLANLSIRKTVRVCCRGDSTITVVSVPSVVTDEIATSVVTQIPTITSANLVINKVA